MFSEATYKEYFLTFQSHIFLVNFFGTSHHEQPSCSPPSPPMFAPPTPSTLPPKKERGGGKPMLCCPYTHWSMVTWSGQPPQGKMNSSLPTPHQKPQLRSKLSSEGQVQLSTAHEHFRQQPRPWTSGVTNTSTGISIAPGCIRTTDPLMVLRCFTGHGLQHGLRRPATQAITHIQVARRAAKPRHQSEAQTTYVRTDLRLHLGLGQQHGPQTTSTWHDKNHLWPREGKD